MASLQAHLAVWMIKRRVKRRLKNCRDHRLASRILRPPPYKPPASVRFMNAEVGGIPGEWVESPGSAQDVLLYLHGGGYFACSAETHRPITAFFALQGFRVFAPNYRLAPENPFPAAVDDAVAVYRGLLGRGHSAERLVVAGDSAGGGLALSLMLVLRTAAAPLPAAAALFSPWTDLAATGESVRTNARRCAIFHGPAIAPTARLYLGSADPRNPLASPLYGDLSGLPPLLVHVGANETLRDDSTRLAEKAGACGVPVELKVWPVVPHVWQLAPYKIPEARQSLREAAEFLLRHAAAQEPGRVGLTQHA
jgi:epsilon-lactone hydrolase